MIVKFFKGKHETCFDGLEYLESGTKTRKVAPQLLRGNPALTREYLKQADKFSKAYSYGCLSFEEDNISDEQKITLMNEFEHVLLAGLDQTQYDLVWIEHRDKKGLELNFHVVNMELTSKKSFTPYVHKRDLGRIDAWKNLVNDRFNYSNPNDPQKQRSFMFGNNSKPRLELMKQVDEYVLDLALDGALNSQQDIINALNEIDGITVTRNTKSSISFKAAGYEKPIRLKNESIYGKHFKGITNLEEQQRERAERFQRERKQRIDSNRKELTERLATIAKQRRAQYPIFAQQTEAKELDIPNDIVIDANSNRITRDVIPSISPGPTVSKVLTSDQELTNTRDLLQAREPELLQIFQKQINKNANNNNYKLREPSSWVKKIFNHIEHSIEQLGTAIKSLGTAVTRFKESRESVDRISVTAKQNCDTLDKLLREKINKLESENRLKNRNRFKP